MLFSECICACRKSVDIDGKLLPLIEKSCEVKHYAPTEPTVGQRRQVSDSQSAARAGQCHCKDTAIFLKRPGDQE